MRSLLIALVLLVPLPAAAQRLPDTVRPREYTLWFAPDLASKTFRGRETIQIAIAKPTARLTLHAAEIRFDSVRITAGGRTQAATVTEDAPREMVTLAVPDALPAGDATIAIEFLGQLNDKLRGFYLSEANGRRYAVSQMEATDARRAFPCFDEPAMKATFDITLMVDQGDMAISNGAQIADEPGPEPGKHTVRFATTRPMSSYLVALLVGQFACRGGDADGIPVRVCSTPEKQGLTAFALEATQHVMRAFNEYFQVRYPFGKLDLIGVPDFAAGAMENTGAITFREADLLADPVTASRSVRKDIASTIAHEIAHQWFGDLVTMQWWDDIWLNEGFATWAATKPLATWHPDWHVDLDEVDESQIALGLDSMANTRAIRTPVQTPDEINEVFDPIAYQKGASVLRMIEAYVGPAVFRAGVTDYLERYRYANATSEDFWNAIAHASEKPVDAIMRSFVTQAGAPLVTVKPTCTAGQTTIALSQQRFVSSPEPAAGSSEAWKIPVCIKGATAAASCTVLEQPTQQATTPGCGVPPFVNAGGRGYFLSRYDEPALVAFAASGTSRLSPAERIVLLGDEWALSRAGRTDVTRVLLLAEGLAMDPTPAVVNQFENRLSYIARAIHGTSSESAYRLWLRHTFGPALAQVGTTRRPEDSEDTRALRAVLLQIVGRSGRDPQLLETARTMADGYLRDAAALDPTVAPVVLQMAAIDGDAALFDRYVAAMTRAASPDVYDNYLRALAQFTRPELVERALKLSLSDQVRTQDAPILVGSLLASLDGHAQAWQFLKENWSAFEKRLGIFQGIPPIVGATRNFCSDDLAKDVQGFFAAHPVPAAARSLRLAIEANRTCVAFRARQEAPLSAFVGTAH